MPETDVTVALTEALCDARFVHLWTEIVNVASGGNPRARYGGAGRVVEAGDVTPDLSGEGDCWCVPATVAFRIDFGGEEEDLDEHEVMFRVYGPDFPPQIDHLELARLA
jgi:hypothetical protein